MALSRRRFVWILARSAAAAPLAACASDDSGIDPLDPMVPEPDSGPETGDDTDADVDAGHDAGPDEPELPPVDPQPAFDFLHGVASGDPLSDRVILWTRVSPSEPLATSTAELTVDFVVATDPTMQNVVGIGRTTTSAARDFTVKVDASGLSPGTTYYYEFFDPTRPDVRSPLGRTRTLPVGSLERARFAFVSCSCYALGYFHTYADIASRNDLDAVLHLGDYIYEYGPDVYADQEVMRPHEPNHEIVTLHDYRQRYAQYRTDPDLQEAHRQHPFITIWDDHELANNTYRDGAGNHTENTEGPFSERKKAALTAYHEWMPIRTLDATDLTKIYRTFQFGDLVDLFMLETRMQRDKQDRLAAKNAARTMLGPKQTEWIEQELAASQARGTSWRVLGQTVMFGRLELPLLGLLNDDQWDGYDASRERLLNFITSEGIDNLVVLTGDIHSAWAMDIAKNPYDAAQYDRSTGAGSLAVEFVCTSVTSPALEAIGALSNVAVSAVLSANPHMKYVDLQNHGYCILDVDHTRVQCEWYITEDIKSRVGVRHSFAKAFTVDAGAAHLVESATPTPPIPGRAPLA